MKGERIGQGRENVKKLLKESPELAVGLEREIRKKAGLLHEEHEEKEEKEGKK